MVSERGSDTSPNTPDIITEVDPDNSGNTKAANEAAPETTQPNNEELVSEESGEPILNDEIVVDKPFEVATDQTAERIDESLPQTNALQEKTNSANLDLNSVSSFLEADPDSIRLISHSILLKIQARASQLTELESDKTILEVNLEQATHLANKRADLFKNQLEKSKQENQQLREESTTLESAKLELEQQLSELQLELNSKLSESSHNQAKLDDVLAEKRKTIELLEGKSKEIESLKADYNGVQESNSKLRKELIDLETSNQTISSNLTQSRMRVQSLETQLELLNNNNDWLSKELKSVSDDFSNYRKEKFNEVSTLQSDLETKSSDLVSLKSRYETLSSRFEEISSKLDNALVQVKELKDEKSQTQEELFKEISVKDRLVTLLKKSNEDLKGKVEFLEKQLNSSNFGVATESAALQSSIDSYKTKLARSETKIQQLEETIEKLTQLSHPENKSVSTLPSLSPSAQAAAKKATGFSLSQLYSEFTLVKRQLVQERRAKERMQQQIDAFVTELEQKAPLINATKERAAILEKELTHLSVILENTTKEKESLQRSTNERDNKLQEYQLQITTLNKQRVDLARQVQNLLVQVTIRSDSHGPLTPAERQALVRIANGDRILNESDTDKLISERLVVFQNVVDLQKKNEELLRIIRELGSKLEKEEQTSKSRLEDLESIAISEAKEAILTLQEEVTSVETKLNSVTRERDMFRSMLSSKSGHGNILTSDITGNNSDEIASLSKKYEISQKQISLLNDQLKEIKVESDTTIRLLNQQISSLSSERSELAINLAREKSTSALNEGRYKSLQENFKFAKSEADELRNRGQQLQENLAKQEVKAQQAIEEMLQNKSLIESLRSENTNLKAEKEIWSTIEKRLAEENVTLIEEKGRLNSLLFSIQSIEKEREANASESQRRLVLQSESLEAELSTLRKRLEETYAELKESTNRREADARAYQERIDSLRTELSSYREELSNKKSIVESLEGKLQSLTAKLSYSESRLQDYQNITASANSESSLVAETLKLKANIEDTKAELEEANNTAEKFRSIAAAAEETMSSINESFDSYKENTTQKIEALEKENKSLNEKISILSDHSSQLNDELTQAKSTANKEAEEAKQEIAVLRSQLSETNKLKEDYDAKIALIDESYKQQVSIAAEAQKNYDKELQKHAEVSKAFSSLRDESNQLKEHISTLSIEAKQAKNELENSQKSWDAQKLQLEEELRIATSRVQDLTSQNHILYNQIEGLTKTNETAFVGTDGATEGSDNELRELISLLRREKEISETQLDVATRDLKRVRQQLELANTELDKTRLELSKSQTDRSDVDKLSKDHKDLLQEIEQLSLLRESNTTLRNELRENIAKVKNLEAKLSEANDKLEPLGTRVVQLNAEIMHKGKELELVVEDRDRWKQRSQDILNKYDRIDPDEHGSLKKQVEELKGVIEELKKKNDEYSESLKAEASKSSQLASTLGRLKTEAQEKIKRRGEEKKEIQRQLTEATAELEKLKESSHAEITKLAKDAEDLRAQLEVGTEKKNFEVDTKELDSLKSQLKSKEEELAKAQEYEAKYKELVTSNKSLEANVEALQKEVDALKQQLAEVSAAAVAPNPATSANDAELIKLREELEERSSELSKFHEDLTKTKDELSKEKEALDKAKSELETAANAANATAALESNGADIEAAIKEREIVLRATIEEQKNKELDEYKRKLRAPSEQKLQEIAERRATALKKELETKYLKEIEELRASQGSTSNDAEITNLKKQLETKQAEMTAKLEEQSKRGFEQGREAALKEVNMRSRLLQSKIEKLTKEKKALEAEIEAQKSPESIPNKPDLAKSQDNGDSPGTKRPAESATTGSPEKKIKNDS